MNYTLTYRKNKSQVVYVEEIGKENKPYFEQEYNEALNLILEIVDLQKKNGKEISIYGCNNRILFTGPRGCGKTSVMRSIAHYLSNPETKLKDKDDKEKEVDVKFICLPMVDPSHFDNNNNILLTVITNMFSEAKRQMNKSGDKGDTSDREELLKQFEKVFKSLDSIKSEVSSYTLESLNRKSDAEDLREKMNELVAKYLKYLNKEREVKLVLLIDDIDMSVSHAPDMLEQLRKYLELDNLIILMSANLGQLSNEMREKYSSAFQNTLKDSNQSLSIDVEDLATKYLLKLFPTSRRVNVERHVSQLLKTELIIEDNKDAANNHVDNFQKVILSLIWRKTRLLFIPKDPENTLHPIIPTNLRDLAQFLDMLTDLPNVDYISKDSQSKLFADGDAYRHCEDNIQTFKGYVMNTWIPNRLSVDEEMVFENIPTDITEINKHLINSINVIGTKHKTRLMSREVSLDMIERNAENINIDRDIYTMVSPNDPKFVKANKISDIFNQPSNYSYGDLLLMIDKYETYFESEEDRRFTDAIKIYYSILLFETMFFKSQNVDYKYKENDRPSVIPIQKLIGGNVYYPNYFEIITDENFNQKGPSFDAKRAFYHKVEVSDDNKVGVRYPLFSVLYYGDIRPDRYEKDHIYDTTFNKNAEVDGVNYVTFDILSVLNNMLNPCQTLSRLDNRSVRPPKWEDIVGNIAKWGDCNKINGKSIPNAVLPFYAVDLMLTYLRRDYSTTDLFKKAKVQGPDTKDAKKLANTSHFFFESSPEKMKSILGLLDAMLKHDQTDEESDFELLRSIRDAVSETTSDSIRVLKENMEIIIAAHEGYSKAFKGHDNKHIMTVDLYRNQVEALIQGKVLMSKKEREAVIKELRKYSSITEIFKHIVDVLWENKIKEICIRGKIQEEVRSFKVVQAYYQMLWGVTEDMFNLIDCFECEKKPITVYEELFRKAKIYILSK